jgi:diacylglycerol kinase (ATP)
MSAKGRLILNPGAGRGRGRRRAEALETLARHHGLELKLSRDAADLTALAAEAARDGLERVFVAGGDGTLHWAIQGLVGSETALAPIPLGSGNDLAMALATPLGSMERALDVGATAEIGSIDLARIDTSSTSRHYSCVASCGFDAAVNAVANRITAVSGPIIYVWAVLRTLAGFRPPHLHIEWDDGCWDAPAMFAVTANGSSYGGGMRIAPAASLVDGVLDVVVVKAVSKATLLAVFPKVFSGRHINHPAVIVGRGSRIRLQADPSGDLYGDGELVGSMQGAAAEITVAPRALRVVTTVDALHRANVASA